MRHSSRVGSGTMPRFTMVAQRRRSESNRRIEVLQTSALPLGYGAARRKLAISLDFLNPPREVLPTSLSLRRAAPEESRTAEIAGLPSPLEEYALSQESVWGFLWVLVVRQAHCGSSPHVHPQARAPDPIVDLAAGPLEPGLEAWVVPHLVVDPRGDDVELLAYGREGIRPFQPRERLLRVAGPRVILRTPRAVIAGLRSEAWGATICTNATVRLRLASALPLSSRSKKLRVHVLAHPDVVQKIPARVIRIQVDDELVARPAPGRGDRPIPVRNLEHTAWQPNVAGCKVKASDRVGAKGRRARSVQTGMG